MNVRLARRYGFEAAHRLPRVPPDHKCARIHGHSYRIEVEVKGPVDEHLGWYVDYAVIDRAFEPLRALLDHCLLNEIPGLENPTSENLVRFIYARLAPVLPGLARVVVHETPDSSCQYPADA